MKSKKNIYYGAIIDKETKIIALNSHLNMYRFSKEIYNMIDGNLYLICGIWWTIEPARQILKTMLLYYYTRLRYPRIKITLLANTSLEVKLLNILGIKSILCNHNCFIDENIFTIKNLDKKFDAVYNAVLLNFKRHYLLKKIKNIALITYNFTNVKYKSNVDTILDEHVWVNYDKDENARFLNEREIVTVYNQSKIGIALSKEEGAMYSSNEYLLCGLPVLSTYSKGGRDIFYNKDNSILVEDNEQAVKIGFDQLLQKECDPYKIRQYVLSIMHEHRQHFFSLVNQIIINESGKARDISETWDKWFVNKLRNELSIDNFNAWFIN